MIPLVDLKAQHDSIRQELFAAITNVVDTSSFIMGPAIKEFEAGFAEFCGCQHAIGVSSGTSALHVAMSACGLQAGDEVITIPHTFIATAEAATMCGARVVFVDIDPITYTMDVSKLEAAITPRTKIVVPVHLYGHPTDMDPLMATARRHGLRVIEDCAQAHGAEYKGKRVGSIGDAGCFSFFPAKNLGALGDAGAVVSSDDALAEKARLLRDHGRNGKYHHAFAGFNERLDTLQAAVLMVKLPHLEAWNEARIAHAADYTRLIALPRVIKPVVAEGCKHVYHQYVIRHPDRESVRSHLRERDIATGVHYPLPLHLQPAYAGLGYKEGDFPETEKAAGEILSLPMFPEMALDQVTQIAAAINEWSSAG